jgi:hypothetical protein
MYLYRVYLGDVYTDKTEDQIKDIMVFPNIPYFLMGCEDGETERICLSESIEGCLTSIGWNRIDIAFQDQTDEDIDCLRIVVLKFKKENLEEKYLFSPEYLTVKNCVPDAEITKEWWYLLPVKPDEVEIKYLYGYNFGNAVPLVLPEPIRKKILIQTIKDLKWAEAY